MKRSTLQSSPFGPVVVLWRACPRGIKVVRVLLSDASLSATAKASQLSAASDESSSPQVDALLASIRLLLAGEAVDFDLDLVDLGACGAFQRRVLRAEHAIPRRRVSTYGLIAAHLGVPGGARAVGNALARNPFPLIVPCHRAIRSDRRLGGYQGGMAMKRALLRHEGHTFDDVGRVRCSAFHYA